MTFNEIYKIAFRTMQMINLLLQLLTLLKLNLETIQPEIWSNRFA